MNHRVSAATVAVVATVGLCCIGTAGAGASPTNELDIIRSVAPEVLTEAPTAPEESTAQLHEDATSGISVEAANGEMISVSLPFDDRAGRGTTLADGKAVAFDNANGTSTVPVLRGETGVSIQSIIENRQAPTRFGYELDLPEGSTLHQTEDGGIAILDEDGDWLAGIGAPWAKDADGNDVPTRYVISGHTVTQVINHPTARATYPIVADPFLGIDLFSRTWWTGRDRSRVAHLDPTPQMGVAWAMGKAYTAGWPEAKQKMGNELNKETYRQQFKCHADHALAAFIVGSGGNSSWDLEYARGTVRDPGNVARHKCNW